MKYRKDGRTYRLVRTKAQSRSLPRERLSCYGCRFFSVDEECLCDTDDIVECARGDVINRIWRETLFSKIRNWRRKG